MTLAFSNFMKKDTAKAVEYMGAAFDLSSTNSTIVSNYMQALLTNKEYEKVLEVGEAADWDELSGSSYKKYETKSHIATAYNNLGRHDEALVCIKQAISEADYYNVLHVTLAETFAYLGEIDSFYYRLEYVFEGGYDPKWLILKNGPGSVDYQKPFDYFVNDQRFIDLIEKYRTEEPLKG